MKLKVVFLCFILSYSMTYSQYIEDALRYAKSNGIITPRAAAMNISFHGISDDIAALYYNPAGLTLIGKSELSVGLGFTRNSNETNYLNTNDMLKSNNEYITHIGLALPVQFEDTKAAIAIGYFLEDDYTSNMSYRGFNPKTTLIGSESSLGPRSLQDNWSYLLYLSNNEGLGSNVSLVTPFKDSLNQSSLVAEGGGLQNVSGGMSFDVSEYVSLGIGITGKWGDYSYRKEYTESDDLGLYANTPIEGRIFERLKTNENLSQKVSGINATIGFQARLSDFFRFGIAVKTPTWYQVDETFDARYDAFYRSGHKSEYYQYDGKNSYNLRTPFVYSAGLSIHGEGLTFAAGIEYSDATQLKFSDAIPEVMALNNRIMLELVGRTTWGFGLEYDIPLVPIVARASYSRTTSPYQLDIPNANLTNFSVGAGVYLGKKVRIDGVFRWIEYSEQRTNFKTQQDVENYANYVVNRMPLNISLGLTYRY
jgi:long-subunit fatty acid transport protein